MVKRILIFSIFPLLIIAFLLAFLGVRQVTMGNSFYLWVKDINRSFEHWSFKIPSIPKIPLVEYQGDFVKAAPIHRVTTVPVYQPGNNTLSRLTSVLNLLIMFFNFLIGILNITITIINVLLQLIQYLLTMVYEIRKLPQYLSSNDGSWVVANGWNQSLFWWQNVDGTTSFLG